jgi:hypothetical protein
MAQHQHCQRTFTACASVLSRGGEAEQIGLLEEHFCENKALFTVQAKRLQDRGPFAGAEPCQQGAAVGCVDLLRLDTASSADMDVIVSRDYTTSEN